MYNKDMRIELNNKTHWRSDHIKAFIAHVAKDERPDLCKRGAPALHVRVVYTRNSTGSSSGYATLRSNSMCVRVSKHNPDKVDFAFVIAHELAHTRGVDHDKMRNHPRYRRYPGKYKQIFAWGADFPLEPTTPKTTTKRPPVELTIIELAMKYGFTLVDLGAGEYELFAKEGHHLGNGAHSYICWGTQDVRESIDAYQLSMEPCEEDCDCKQQER